MSTHAIDRTIEKGSQKILHVSASKQDWYMKKSEEIKELVDWDENSAFY